MLTLLTEYISDQIGSSSRVGFLLLGPTQILQGFLVLALLRGDVPRVVARRTVIDIIGLLNCGKQWLRFFELLFSKVSVRQLKVARCLVFS